MQESSPENASGVKSNARADQVLADLEPIHLWQSFDGIRRVPRPSKHEAQIIAHVDAWAASHGFQVRHDALGNRVIVVPASPGREEAPITVLQAHLDMVCEKNSDVEHDFMKDPIRLRRDGDWIRAEGTTLGADNGLGVAAAMAVAIDPQVEHGPLELLFTLDEETGLNGAAALDGSLVEGRDLVNLDTEEDGAIYIGCAGAAGVLAGWSFRRVPVRGEAQPFLLVAKGLAGGHSGVEIHQPRGNAIKVVGRVLSLALERNLDLDLISIDGGSKANAIPRECFCRLGLQADERSSLEEILAQVRREVEGELGDHEPSFELLLEATDTTDREALTSSHRDQLVRLLDATHHGVWMMSSQVPGLVETSSNLAVVATEEGSAQVQFSLRSSSNEALARVAGELVSLSRLAGAEAEVDSGYPGWAPNPSSPLVQRTAKVYENLFGEAPEIKAVHAGLECGLLSERLPGLQAVSIGPEILGAHSPDERVNISSAARFYQFLGELLGELSAS